MAGSLRDKIADYINKSVAKGFQWGENDCALFANNHLAENYGYDDLAKPFRGKYTDFKSGLELVNQAGYKDAIEMADKHLVRVNRPSIGDVALYLDERCLGICLGAYSYFLTADFLTRIPNRLALKFWRVPCQQQFL